MKNLFIGGMGVDAETERTEHTDAEDWTGAKSTQLSCSQVLYLFFSIAVIGFLFYQDATFALGKQVTIDCSMFTANLVLLGTLFFCFPESSERERERRERGGGGGKGDTDAGGERDRGAEPAHGNNSGSTVQSVTEQQRPSTSAISSTSSTSIQKRRGEKEQKEEKEEKEEKEALIERANNNDDIDMTKDDMDMNESGEGTGSSTCFIVLLPVPVVRVLVVVL